MHANRKWLERERGEAVVEGVEVTKRAGRVAIKNLSFSQQYYRQAVREEVRFFDSLVPDFL